MSFPGLNAVLFSFLLKFIFTEFVILMMSSKSKETMKQEM